jgi:hypothetical protein
LKGAKVIRTHNVKQTRLALKTLDALPTEVMGRMKLIESAGLSATIDSRFLQLLERIRRKRL